MSTRAAFAFLFASCLVAAPVLADPVKEVADMGPARIKAFMQGDADGWTADMADNASFQSQYSPFRVDGKQAIRAYFADLFNRYPGARNLQVSQATMRAYGENVVVANGYYQLTLTDKAGKPATSHARYSATWVKTDGRWKMVDQHHAPLPGAQ
jgi:uncharacterized protein (TIGR02246 family)